MFTVRLHNSILGWMLVPVSEGSAAVLTELYARDYGTLLDSERAFMQGESVEAALTHVRDVCKDMKIGMSVCGSKTNPTIRFWWTPVSRSMPDQVSVDLKWSCWTTDQSIWDEYAPGVWSRMEAAFTGRDKPLRVSTGPRKEIRFGGVTISKGQAEGYFCTEWDEIESLAETLETEPDEGFAEMIPHSVFNMAPGMDWEFKVKARKFTCLIKRIDAEENKLLETDEREWGYIRDCFVTRPTP